MHKKDMLSSQQWTQYVQHDAENIYKWGKIGESGGW